MVKALQVTIEGKVVGTYVPAEGETFAVFVGNVPRTYMRAQVVSGSDTESWYWQLPDIREGQVISFKMIEASAEEGVRPQRIEQNDPDEIEENKREAKEMYRKAMRERGKNI